MRLKKIFNKKNNVENENDYFKRFKKYSFYGIDCKNIQQYEACITRLYHTLEKGLAYKNFKSGFGKDNLNALIDVMEKYANEGNDINVFFYRTSLCVLNEYVKKNKKNGYSNESIEHRIMSLPGIPNEHGGTIAFKRDILDDVKTYNFEKLIKSRHSVREFDDNEVSIQTIKEAIEIAQYTPSACNRQGWKCRIINNKEIISLVLSNQNGNRGFGDKINKLLFITADLQYFNRDREEFQAFIDGGMYAANMLNALFYKNIASIPLSAALTKDQESTIRTILNVGDSEVFIIFIGLGNYPDQILTTKSKRHEPRIEVI